MLREVDNFFLSQKEPEKSCLLYLRIFIKGFDRDITEEWKYRMPFYYYNGRMLCYLWTNKKTGEPYIGFADGYRIDHPMLVMGERARMKILPVDSGLDIPIDSISSILNAAIECHKI